MSYHRVFQRGLLSAALALLILFPFFGSSGSAFASSSATLTRPITSKASMSSTPTAPPLPAQTSQAMPNVQERVPDSPAGGNWVQIAAQGFEGTFPTGNWIVRDHGSATCSLCWGRSTYWYWDGTRYRYRANTGSYAAWPVASGSSSYSPYTNPNYANNMDTRMIYGPFDLSDAIYAGTDFYLWRQIELRYNDEIYFDYLAFEISLDGVNFQELRRWDGFVENWEDEWVPYDTYVGNSQVWIAFRFRSDSFDTYQGPWVDDVYVWKFIPGQITVQGTFSYFERDNTTLQPARLLTAYLYDSNPSGIDELVATTTTSSNGYFQFPSVRNWEDDNTTRDLYVTWETAYNDSGGTYANPTRRVTDFGNNAYRYDSPDCSYFYGTSCPDGTLDFSSIWPVGAVNIEALWIFQDLRRGWEYMLGQTGSSPGSATARWQTLQNTLSPCTSGSCFYAAPGGPYIFIAHSDTISADTVIHELGHNYMYNASGYWLWNDPACLFGHNIRSATSLACAWSEGWADFFPLVANGDACYDFGRGPCTGTPNSDHYNLETHSRNDTPQSFAWGDAVEGRVAGALYDLLDYTNDGYDQIGFGFAPIWNVVKVAPVNFWSFWSYWKTRGYEKHYALQSIYQNTIDYDTAPSISNLPTLTLLQGITYNHAVDLWPYTDDPESTDSQLTYSFVSATDARCGTNVDSHYVNFAVQPGWSGSCGVTIRTSDNIKATNGTFIVNVVPVRARIYLPFIAK
ncbi:MAG: hypothetical protein HY782_23160 [Chloroflexi bacterium]|nr:hypothetical protein [Chloroflexota bacterium]